MYKLLTLELKGYNRLMLETITHIKLTFTDHLQLILGTNGVGKSAMLKEASVLPASGSDYAKDGFKEVTVLAHDGRIYCLRNTFHTQTGKHSFKTDQDEELNEGGTLTVQKELVRKYFKITPEIQNIIVGRETFHDMSPSRRREWLTIFSEVSYDYAIETYDRIAQRYRDNEGFLRLTRKRLAEETSKLISPEEENRIQREVDEITRDLELMQANRAPIANGDVERATRALQSKLDEVESLSKAITRREAVNERAVKYGNLSEIETKIHQLSTNIGINERMVSDYMVSFKELSETRDILIKTGAEGADVLEQKLDALRDEYQAILKQRALKLEGFSDDPVSALAALKTVYDTLESIFTDIPGNSDGKYTKAGLAEITNKIYATKERQLVLDAKERELLGRKAHIEEHLKTGEQTCPACNHRWVNGYREGDLDKVASLLEQTAIESKDVERVLAELSEENAAYDAYRGFYGEYTRCVKAWNILDPFWTHLNGKKIVVEEPRRALVELSHLLNDLNLEVRAFQISKEIENIKDLIVKAKMVGNSNLIDVDEKIAALEVRIEATHGLVVSSKSELIYCKQLVKDIGELQAQGQELSRLLKAAEALSVEEIEMTRRSIIEKTIRALQLTLARRSEILQTHLRQKDLIEDLKKQIDNGMATKEATTLLMDELSPTKGLIALGLMGFIKRFVAKMNALIRRIWSYPLEIKPCGSTDGVSATLDYKFPLMVNRPDNVVPDIAMGSSGMFEIIDLAFRIVAMRYLDITQTPFYLDEFGKAMDIRHRQNTISMINTIVETEKFSQLFIVSHDYSQYGAFVGAEVCVLSEANIVTPDVYNQHVQFI